jgi:hypothetical protein
MGFFFSMKFAPKLPRYMTTDDLVNQVEVLDNTKQTSGLGWSRFTSTYRTLQAYRHKALGIVLKKPNCILEPRTPLSVRVPTVKLKNGWVMQPLVKKVELRKACDIISGHLKDARERQIYPDLHTGNVGWYNGHPVMFDW